MSLLVGQCKKEVKMLKQLFDITTIWALAYTDHNEPANELTKTGSALDINNAANVAILLGVIWSTYKLRN